MVKEASNRERSNELDEQTSQAMRLWTLAQPVVSAFIASVVRDFSARNDVLQETAVAVIDSFARYDSNRPFVSWALGIAQNQVRLHLRRCHRDRHVFDDDVVSQLVLVFETVSSEQLDALSYLRECLGELHGRAREMCELRYVQDLKPSAIAESMGMAANSVAKALQRIRDQLRECIARKAAAEGGMS